VTIVGKCGTEVEATFNVGSPTLQMSGIRAFAGTAPVQEDFNNSASRGLANPTLFDFNGVMRGNATSKFAQVVLHGEKGAGSCTFWGMVIPSS
jgi:hypothetical protein